jgi:hypothetical protein
MELFEKGPLCGPIFENYLVSEILKIVKQFRKARKWNVDFGNACERAAINAIKHPNTKYPAGRLIYCYDPYALDGLGALFCELPSGRELCYPEARLEAVVKDWGTEVGITARKGAWRPKKDDKRWPRIHIWKGLLLENATQGACADVMNIALCRAYYRPYYLSVCAHTHDEIIVETEYPNRAVKQLKSLMEAKPGWEDDEWLPLQAEIEYGYRYKVAA